MPVRQLPFGAKAVESQVPTLQPRDLATMTVDGEVVGEDVLDHLHHLCFLGGEGIFGHVLPSLAVSVILCSVDALEFFIHPLPFGWGLFPLLNGMVREVDRFGDVGVGGHAVFYVCPSLYDCRVVSQ